MLIIPIELNIDAVLKNIDIIPHILLDILILSIDFSDITIPPLDYISCIPLLIQLFASLY